MAYSDIDSGKVLNKEGLLELSGQIKGYINTNMPQSYTLPTASTSTLGGVKVDGETITIEDGVISAVSSGSDSSSENKLSLSIWGNPYMSTAPWTTINATSGADFISKIITGNPITAETSDGIRIANLKAVLPSGISQILYWDDTITSASNKFSNITNQTWFYLTNYHQYQMFKYNDTSVVIYHTTVSGRNYYSHLTELLPVNNSTYGVYNLGSLLTKIVNNSIPTAPTTDGTYMLKCVVSSGTPTYSWESVNVGGSY